MSLSDARRPPQPGRSVSDQHQHRLTTDTPKGTRTLWRVRWRGSGWKTSTVSNVRYFHHGRYAALFVEKLTAKGYLVELSRTEALAWGHVSGALE